MGIIQTHLEELDQNYNLGCISLRIKYWNRIRLSDSGGNNQKGAFLNGECTILYPFKCIIKC